MKVKNDGSRIYSLMVGEDLEIVNENVLLIKDIMNWGNNEQDMIQRYSNHTEAYDLEKARATSKILN